MWEQELEQLVVLEAEAEPGIDWESYLCEVQAALETWWDSSETASIVQNLCEAA
jgi:hypothetical protein